MRLPRSMERKNIVWRRCHRGIGMMSTCKYRSSLKMGVLKGLHYLIHPPRSIGWVLRYYLSTPHARRLNAEREGVTRPRQPDEALPVPHREHAWDVLTKNTFGALLGRVKMRIVWLWTSYPHYLVREHQQSSPSSLDRDTSATEGQPPLQLGRDGGGGRPTVVVSA